MEEKQNCTNGSMIDLCTIERPSMPYHERPSMPYHERDDSRNLFPDE